jgi:hypothetical protein
MTIALRTLFLALTLLCLATGTAEGQVQTALGVGIGGTSTDDFAFTLAGFGELRVGHIYGSTGLDVTIGPGEEDGRYYRDVFASGQSRCRDASCVSSEIDLALPIEGGLAIPLRRGAQLLAGAGLRVSRSTHPYAAFGYRGRFGDRRWWTGHVAGGEGFVRVLISTTFPIG